MKNLLPYFLIAFLLQFSVSAFATDFYSIKSGNASEPATWNSIRNGSGTTPATFNNPEDNFIVQDGSVITGSANFGCKGSLIIEAGGMYNTGYSGNKTTVASVVTINNGGIFRLSPNTTLIAGFILVQGNLENHGGEINFRAPSPVISSFSFQKH